MERKVLDKLYNPQVVEEKWYRYWQEHKLFHADATTDKKTYVIMIPPPNVTGMLTMGHILNNTIQDMLIRWKKMQGFETLWMPGTDHAGIATQNKVEQAIAKEGLTRHVLGREKFLQRVWQWKEKYGGIILQQLRKLGASCDWDREAFTMNEPLSHAVRFVFVSLYNDGLLYRGNRLINWCPSCHTALADEEVLSIEEEGGFWSIAYPLVDDQGEIVVVTTRPETMLGDTAVAVHPQDERYTHLIGRRVIIPLANREIPIIADEHADPQLGSGAVKITPAHDFNDLQVAQRHALPFISVIDSNGKMDVNAGVYAGMDRFAARKKVLEDLRHQGFLRKEEKKIISIPRCYRSNDIVEPHLSDQWFVRMQPLAEQAIEVVRQGKVRFHPQHWQETYFHWMENIRDWCISRQIWWGHRIPAWYCEHNHITVSMDTPSSCTVCGSSSLRQDEDVLDTWFSSWLWPFSTLGWPEQTRELQTFFPTNTLVTGPDIIFFWVARMIMASLYFMKDIPFTDVYFNGMIRDLQGFKMSKSRGNSPDPLWLIDGADKDQVADFAKHNPSAEQGIPAYGADAVRLTMLYSTPLGGDIRFDQAMTELGQKFANKLWNAARFVLMNLDERQLPLNLAEIGPDEMELADQWILSRLHKAIHVIHHALASFKVNDATHALYSFVWSEYCDWYLELIKSRLYDESQARSQHVARSLALVILDYIVRLLHPVMPFITEEIWQALPIQHRQGVSILQQTYPRAEKSMQHPQAERAMVLLQQVIGAVRNIRGEMNVPPAKEADLILHSADQEKLEIIRDNETALRKLARISSITYEGKKPSLAASSVVQGIELYVPLADLIDVDVEKSRLQKEIDRLEGQLQALTMKLSNENFVSRAPKEVVEKEQQKKADWENNLQKLRSVLSRLLDQADNL
ncbi:MAG: valine--tRNA ligase [Calditrichaeota bacterium]|nr:MAG: valine--tRNA ligase [Calditrichota bacterium]